MNPNPLWIIDLTGTNKIIFGFYKEYWDAYKTNLGLIDVPPWFYITDANDLELSLNENELWSEDIIRQKISKIITSHAKLLTLDIPPQEKKIQYLYNVAPNTINVVLIGDIGNIDTQRFFNLISIELRKVLLTSNPWTNVPNIFFYGLLYRRESVSISDNLKIEEKVFLHQLHNMTSFFNINNRPFFNVLFFQSQESVKDEMFKTMALASLHLGLGNDNILSHYQQDGYDRPFLNAGVAGVFFEQNVQNDREAFMLGHTLIDAFTNNNSEVFYNKENAITYVNQLSVFKLNSFSYSIMIKEFISDTKSPDISKLAFEPEIKPCSWSLQKVWTKFFNDFIINLKKNIVNITRFELLSIEETYKEKVSENQLKWLKAKTRMLEDSVFDVFNSEQPHLNCSLIQAIEVTEQCNAKIESLNKEFNINLTKGITITNASDNSKKIFTPFPLSEKYQKAYKTASESNKVQAKGVINENEVLTQLESQIKNHPVFFISMLLRALLIGVMLIFVGIPLLQYISPKVINLNILTNNTYILGFVLFLIPVLIFLWRCRSYTNRLNSLKEQYIALSLSNLNKRVEEFLKKIITDSYSQLSDFCEWLKDTRIEKGLRQQLGVLPPPSFSFSQFEHFQPLLIDNIVVGEKSTFLIKPDTAQLKENKPVIISGQFKGHNILQTVPDLKVQLNNSQKKITELTDSDKMELIHKLMKEKAQIFNSLEEETDFSKMKVTSSSSKTLLLDVSGSMSGDSINQLIKIVEEYKNKYGDQIRWIAFATSSELDKDVEYNIKKAEAKCGGGTSYVPAFKVAKANLENGELHFDKLVMISDGGTCDLEEAIDLAKEIGKPVDVIYIGQGSQDHLKKLADETGGQFTVVDKVDDIEQEVRNGLQFLFKLGDTGYFEFWKLLKKGNAEGCARALYTFSKRKMIISEYSIELLLEQMGDNTGISNWFTKATSSCSLNQGIGHGVDLLHFKSSDLKTNISQNDLLNNKILKIKNINFRNIFESPPDLLACVISILPLETGIKDLEWSYSAITDLQIKNGTNQDKDVFFNVFASYFNKGQVFRNLCDQKID